MSGYRPSKNIALKTVVIGVICGGVGVGIFSLVGSYNTQHDATVTICSKERVTKSDGGGEYRVYASNGTYKMADSLIGKVRYSTADAYAKIKPNTTYDITYKGWRIPFMSEFPNILEAKKSAAQTPALCN